MALAVGLTPEFLPMITTVTLAQGAIRMARGKVIVKHLSAIQNLGSIDILCSDKTGTLTAGTLSLLRSLDPEGHASDRPCVGPPSTAGCRSVKSPLDTAILERAPVEDDAFVKTDEIPFGSRAPACLGGHRAGWRIPDHRQGCTGGRHSRLFDV